MGYIVQSATKIHTLKLTGAIFIYFKSVKKMMGQGILFALDCGNPVILLLSILPGTHVNTVTYLDRSHITHFISS